MLKFEVINNVSRNYRSVLRWINVYTVDFHLDDSSTVSWQKMEYINLPIFGNICEKQLLYIHLAESIGIYTFHLWHLLPKLSVETENGD